MYVSIEREYLNRVCYWRPGTSSWQIRCASVQLVDGTVNSTGLLIGCNRGSSQASPFLYIADLHEYMQSHALLYTGSPVHITVLLCYTRIFTRAVTLRLHTCCNIKNVSRTRGLLRPPSYRCTGNLAQA